MKNLYPASNLTHYAPGTNQYRRRFKHWSQSTYANLILIPIIFAMAWTGNKVTIATKAAAETLINPPQVEILSPIPDQPEFQVTFIHPTPRPSPKTVRQIVHEVFGKYASEAFQLLKCENPALDPEAVNYNNDGSIDYGLFQINSHFNGYKQAVNNRLYLFDPEINTRMAWRLFVDSGYSFKLWACNK